MPGEAAIQQTQTSANTQFEALTQEFLASEYAARPVRATALGIHAYDDRLDDCNRFALRAERSRLRAYLHAIDKLSLADLTPDNRLDYRLARSAVQVALAGFEQQRWPERQPGAVVEMIASGLSALIARRFAEPESRAIALRSRLRAIPRTLEEAKQNLARPPRLFIEIAMERIAGCDALCAGPMETFLAPLPEGLRRLASEAVPPARAALADYTRFLQEQMLPESGDDFALGREPFEYLLRVGHFLERDAESCEALLEIGEEALAQAEREMAALAEEIAPGRPWKEILAERKRCLLPADRRAVAYARAIARARAFVLECDLATLPPPETLTMAEAFGPAGAGEPCVAYLPPAPFEPRRDGTFQIAPIAPADAAEVEPAFAWSHSLDNIPLLALHLAYPGHHLQWMRACEAASPFRRYFANSGLFIEGWALYGAEMMREQGFAAEPHARLMHLLAIRLRACRAILDVQMHARRIPLAEAGRFLQEEALLSPAQARAEIQHCALNPTQPMTGMMGMRALLALRDEVRRRQGARFHLKTFHDTILSYGSIPPSLLREAVFSV